MVFTREQLQEAARQAGVDEAMLARLLTVLSDTQPQTRALTIVCNTGIHPIPETLLPGRVVVATEGNVADETPEALEQTVAGACKKIAAIIKGDGPFAEIYLVPSGYGVLLQKLAETIFQITGQPATTLHFDRRTNQYWPIRLDLRALISQT